MHVSRRLAERTDEVAALITAENGKPIKWARSEATRAVATFRWAAEEVRREGGEMHPPRHRGRDGGPGGSRPPVPERPGARHRAVQLPAEPRRAQGGAGARGRRPDHRQAGARHAAGRRLLLGELLAETDLPAGMWSVLPVPNEAMPAWSPTSGCR